MPLDETGPGERTARVSAHRAGAAFGVLVLCCSLPALPVLAAWGVATGLGGRPAAALAAGLAALLGGAKLAAAALGLAGRLGGASEL